MMRQKFLYILVLSAVACAGVSRAEELERGEILAGQDLQVSGPAVVNHRLSTGEHILIFDDGMAMSIGANLFSSGKAVVWLNALAAEFDGQRRGGYTAIAYLTDNISAQKAATALTTDLHQVATRDGLAQVVWFTVSGEVFVSADRRRAADPHGSELYTKAVIALRDAGLGEQIVKAANLPVTRPPKTTGPAEPEVAEPNKPEKPEFEYRPNISPAGQTPLQFTWAKTEDGTEAVTIIGRFYLWQKQDEEGGLLELQADYAVAFFSKDQTDPNKTLSSAQDMFAAGAIKGIYLAGDVLMTKGQRTVRADELYYDFERTRAIIRNAQMRNFDPREGIPIYVRAKELRQVAANKFKAEDVTVTTSEFHKPQIALGVKSIEITDNTPDDERKAGVTKGSYDAEMRGVDFKVYDATVFHLPRLRSNLERPDTALKSAHVGNSDTWGNLIETRWYLAKLLGIQEPEGTESTMSLDYYSKRGVGVGIEIEYVRENYFGRVLGYVIDDRGED
ncbi:MAG: hypothetical protein ACYS8Z_19200, partial [Planctomycetota bacterium]